jgi:hypothetical protein
VRRRGHVAQALDGLSFAPKGAPRFGYRLDFGMIRRLFTAFVACAIAVCGGHAIRAPAAGQPDTRRVALIDPGEQLERAARASLEPWGVELRVVPGPSPGALPSDARDAARTLARAYDAEAVVWTAEHPDGLALFAYDRAADQVTARQLATRLPLDAPGAAAVALSLKTLLRHSEVAPQRERMGSTGESEAPPALAPRPSDLDLDGRVGVRFDRTRPGAIDVRSGLGAVWWPSAGYVGLAVRVASGPGIPLDEALLQGRLIDAELTVAGAARWDLARSLRAVALAGAGVQLVAVDGRVRPDGQPASTLRLNPALSAELGIDWLVAAPLRLGPRAAVSWLLTTQHYAVRGVDVVELSPVAVEAGLMLGVNLPN